MRNVHRRRRRSFTSERAAKRFIKRRKRQFRIALGGAGILAVLLLAMGLGLFGTVAPSYQRLLPAPASSDINVPASVQDGSQALEGPPVNLSDAYEHDDVPVPTRLLIPAIGVDASIQPLGRNPDGTAQVPSEVSYAGWYDLGPRPGQLGPSVILGHVDSVSGPGVFYRLRSLLPGDIITVVSGTKPMRFEVSGLTSYPKDRFPTAEVFGPTPVPELRLVTCSGAFDYATGHYLDNLVVFAILIS
jgi:sortase (surface protein transpeptidase)